MILSTFILVFAASGFSLVTADRDILAGDSDPRCFKTNYKSSPADFASYPREIYFDSAVAIFGYDFPAVEFLISPNSQKKVNQITFESSDNLDNLRVEFTRKWGSPVTTKAIYPNDKIVKIDDIDNIKRVDFYAVPKDYSRDITINDFAFRNCPVFDIGGLACDILDALKDIITIGSLGVIRPGGKTGTFSSSIRPSLPYFEFDLSCSGAGDVTLSQLKFDRISNVKQVLVTISNGAEKVASYTFDPSAPMTFGSGVIGNRIRISFVPETYSSIEQVKQVKISLKGVQILTNE